MIKYENFIPQNTAPPNTKRIGLYDSKGNRIIGISPNGLLDNASNRGEKLYTFGALSDVHITYDTAEEDFQRALTFYNNIGVDFLCICGDLGYKGTEDELQLYKSVFDAYSNGLETHIAFGNHEYYAATSHSYIEQYTGSTVRFTVEKGEDVFIFFGVENYEQGNFFGTEALQWLYETLEHYRNRRCFLFQHVLPTGGCGDIHDLYWFKMTGTERDCFVGLLQHYRNIIFFHGHSHTRFSAQQYGAMANYDNVFGCHSVHIPSCAIPRDKSPSGDTFDVLYAGSEGYVVDVYKNGIHLRGRDFVKGEFLPIASYWLDTPLQTIEANIYVDSTGTITT